MITDDPCDDWASHIERRWVPMLDKRTRAERRAGGEPEQLDELRSRFDREYVSNPKIVIDPKSAKDWTLARYGPPAAPLFACAKCKRPTITGCACVYCNG